MPGGGWNRLNKLIAKQGQAKPLHDVIIIGAGASGLMAAYTLRDMDILLLESESRIGGRINTRQQQGVYYDMGAVFGYIREALPFEIPASQRIEAAPGIGIIADDQVHYGDDVLSVLQKLLNAEERNALQAFIEEKCTPDELPQRLYHYLNAFFQVIHPGEMRNYMPERWQDALTTFDTGHYVRGNGEMVDALAQALEGKIHTDTEVLSLHPQEDRVRVVVRKGEKQISHQAKHIIMTTPAPVTAKLLNRVSSAAQDYLQAWDYAGGTVVMLALKDATIDAFSYLVTPDSPISTIIQQQTQHENIIKLLIYYAGAKHDAVQNMPDDALLMTTIQTLLALNIGEATPQNLLFSDIQRWPRVGPIISSEAAATWQPAIRQATERIWLSGEYTLNPSETIPFGMVPALYSGQETARPVRQIIKDKFYRDTYLIRATIYDLQDDRPVFLQTIEEGNIAYYGLVLQATPNPDLRAYLLRHSVDNLWEYQIDFNPTAEDSLLVIEGLWRTGDAQALLPSLAELVKRFYKEDDGAFHTVLEGRAPYWRGHRWMLLHRRLICCSTSPRKPIPNKLSAVWNLSQNHSNPMAHGAADGSLRTTSRPIMRCGCWPASPMSIANTSPEQSNFWHKHNNLMVAGNRASLIPPQQYSRLVA